MQEFLTHTVGVQRSDVLPTNYARHGRGNANILHPCAYGAVTKFIRTPQRTEIGGELAKTRP